MRYSYRQCPLCVSQTISRQSVAHGQQIVVVVVGLCADSDMGGLAKKIEM